MNRPILKPLYINLVFFVLISSIIFGSNGFESEIEKASKSISSILAQSGVKNVAVVDFLENTQRLTQFGVFLAEEFSVSLASARSNFLVIDRQHLGTILRQHKLSATGLIDPVTTKRMGKIAGVDALITGSYTPFGENVRVAVKVLDVETANIIWATKVSIPRTEAIKKLMDNIIEPIQSISNTNSGGPAPDNFGKKDEDKVFSQSFPKEKKLKPFKFILLECNLTGQSLECKLQITNTHPTEDRRIFINPLNIRIYDESGNEYQPYTIETPNNKSSDDYSRMMKLLFFSQEFFRSIPVTIKLVFKGVNNSPIKMKLRLPMTIGDSISGDEIFFSDIVPIIQ